MRFFTILKGWMPALVLFLFLTQGCQKNKPPEKKLYDQVMSVHDSVMPKMKDIRQGIQYAETALEKEALAESEKKELKTLKRSLIKAEDAMWEWMHGFDAERAKSDTATAYLRDEKVKIKNVSAMMRGSLEEIEAFRTKMEKRNEYETK